MVKGRKNCLICCQLKQLLFSEKNKSLRSMTKIIAKPMRQDHRPLMFLLSLQIRKQRKHNARWVDKFCQYVSSTVCQSVICLSVCHNSKTWTRLQSTQSGLAMCRMQCSCSSQQTATIHVTASKINDESTIASRQTEAAAAAGRRLTGDEEPTRGSDRTDGRRALRSGGTGRKQLARGRRRRRGMHP